MYVLVLLGRLSTWIGLLFVLLSVVSQISSVKRSRLKICKNFIFLAFTVTVTVSDPVSSG
jgi:hypothetical protein